VRIWEVSTGQCLKTLHGHTDWVESVAFSPDGTLLASGGHNGTVSLWDVSSGTCLRMLHSHPSRVWAVSFSLGGSAVISGSEDRTIILWDVRTGVCLNMVRTRLYERMNITGITGLTEVQKATLRELGAVEEGASSFLRGRFFAVIPGEPAWETAGYDAYLDASLLAREADPCKKLTPEGASSSHAVVLQEVVR